MTVVTSGACLKPTRGRIFRGFPGKGEEGRRADRSESSTQQGSGSFPALSQV
jgi:hypothetical protein